MSDVDIHENAGGGSPHAGEEPSDSSQTAPQISGVIIGRLRAEGSAAKCSMFMRLLRIVAPSFIFVLTAILEWYCLKVVDIQLDFGEKLRFVVSDNVFSIIPERRVFQH